MRYALVDADDNVVNVIELETDAEYTPPERCTLVEGRDFAPVNLPQPPPVPITTIDGTTFLGRITDQEYVAITASPNVQVRRWIELLRLRGDIDVSGDTSKAARDGLVALGLLTRDRADVIFAPID